MKMHVRGLAGVAAVLIATAIGFARPAAAQEPFVMPDIEGMILQSAMDEFRSATEGSGLELEMQSTDGMPYEQINLTNWVVCWQSPDAGEELDEDAWAGVGVARPNKC